MIELRELNKRAYPTTPEIDANLNILLERLNKVRVLWGKPMLVTSGLRSSVEQENLIKAGRSNAHSSKHLIGAAADIFDSDKSLAGWIQDNIDKMEEIGFWFEDFAHTTDWVHFQIYPPASGKRIFIP